MRQKMRVSRKLAVISVEESLLWVSQWCFPSQRKLKYPQNYPFLVKYPSYSNDCPV